MAWTLAAAVLAFSASSSSSVFERGGHVAGENLEELQVALAERPRLGALDVERAGHAIVQHDRHGDRAAGALGAFEIERIFLRVFAEIALAGGGHEAGHAVAGDRRPQLAMRRLVGHADGEHRLEDAGLLVEHANLDDVVLQHVLRAVQDVRFQQLDPLVDRHVGDFVGREVGQLDAGLVDRGELLLLQHVVGDVADRDDQMLRRLTVLDDGNGVDAEVAVVAPQRRGAPFAGRQAPCGTGRSRGR